MVRHNYSDEFKDNAVKLAQRADVPVSQSAKELGLNAEVLRRWVKDFGVRADGRRGMSAAEHSELVRLRRETKRLAMENEILKN